MIKQKSIVILTEVWCELKYNEQRHVRGFFFMCSDDRLVPSSEKWLTTDTGLPQCLDSQCSDFSLYMLLS